MGLVWFGYGYNAFTYKSNQYRIDNPTPKDDHFRPVDRIENPTGIYLWMEHP